MDRTSLAIERSPFIIFLLMVFVTMGKYYIYVGFAIKPYMIFCFLFMFFHLTSFYFHKFQLFEIFFFFFYFMYMYSGAFSLYSTSSFRVMVGIGLYLLCYLIIKEIISDSKESVIESALGYAGIVFNLISLFLYILGLRMIDSLGDGDYRAYGLLLDRESPRLMGVLQDPNFFVFYNTLFFTYYLCNSKSLKNKAGLILCLTTSVLTFSRGGLIALVLLFFLYISMNKFVTQLKLLGTLIISLSLIAYIAIVQLNFDMFALLESRVEEFSIDQGSGRFDLWGRALEFFSTNMVSGVGSFNFEEYNYFYYGDRLAAHNTFLEILSESGVFGLFFYLLFILIVFYQLFESKLYRTKPYLFLAFVGYLLQMLSLSLVFNDIFFLFLAILSAYLHQSEYRDTKSPPVDSHIETDRAI
ncbi:O-antigen ligase family protein [Guptibacillus algicola]|uniref:O-antigen ligase family protein n=1 Tax=Guptibacillus algicola TaxID=225844 RepID=UPI001CD7B5C3|nr:O-antigen ligase family protein [Alkalihalobacillus algicola]MCA0987039.1 O-antigen ligase family protein [Alkalihalobacillus algicola]